MRLTTTQLRSVVDRFHDRLITYRDALNRLNVFPVPDGDTGTNLELTVRSVVEAISTTEEMGEFSGALAHSSMLGARGNSGVILAQILRGLADAFRDSSDVGVPELVAALDGAASAAYEAVLHPVEGTILTVIRAAADAAVEAGGESGDDLGRLLGRIYRRAAEALEQTPELLPVLGQAGVVDAGGAGLLLLLAAFVEEATGEAVDLPSVYQASPRFEHVEAASASTRYEVMLTLEASDERLDRFRAAWDRIGDSIVITGGDGTYRCHIHTDHPAAAIEAALRVDGGPVGTFSDLSLADLREVSGDHGVNGVVAVAMGEGISRVFRELGAGAVVAGGQGANPSTRDLLEAIEQVPAPHVLVLPNNKNIVAVARAAAKLSPRDVTVVPTTSIPSGLAAMTSFEPGEAPEILTERMTAASGRVSAGEVTRAVRDATLPIGSVVAGQWLGIVDGDIVVAGDELADIVQRTLEHMASSGAELVTIVTGQGADEDVTESARRWAADRGLDVDEIDGGQPLYPYLLSVE